MTLPKKFPSEAASRKSHTSRQRAAKSQYQHMPIVSLAAFSLHSCKRESTLKVCSTTAFLSPRHQKAPSFLSTASQTRLCPAKQVLLQTVSSTYAHEMHEKHSDIMARSPGPIIRMPMTTCIAPSHLYAVLSAWVVCARKEPDHKREAQTGWCTFTFRQSLRSNDLLRTVHACQPNTPQLGVLLERSEPESTCRMHIR